MKLFFLFLFLPSICFAASQYFYVSQADGAYTENVTINNKDGTSDTNRIFFTGVYRNLGDGNDANDGSEGSPWATIQKAVDTINPASGLPIYVYISGTGTEFPILDPSSGVGILLNSGSSYITFDSLRLSVASWGIICVNENYIDIVNCFVNCNGVGMGVRPSQNGKVINNVIVDCKEGGIGDLNYYASSFTNLEILNNVIVWTPDSQTTRIIAFMPGASSSNITVKNNIAYADSNQGFFSIWTARVPLAQVIADYNFWIRKTSSDCTYFWQTPNTWVYNWASYKANGWGVNSLLLDGKTLERPGYVGTNNIDGYALLGNSLAIDAGLNHSEVLFDIRGNSRIKNYRMDMGAHEYEPVQIID